VSSGHRHTQKITDPHLADQYEAKTRALVDACTVIPGYTVYYVSIRSKDGKIVFIDHRVPRILKCGVDTWRSLPTHELGEWLAENDGLSYDKSPGPSAHVDVATPLELREVRRQFPNDPGIVLRYNREMDYYIDLIDNSRMTDPPPETMTDTRPYTQTHVLRRFLGLRRQGA
jgi:hypothetical protein